jgi:hypothetical protein
MSISCIITAIESGSLCEQNTGLGNVLFQVSATMGIANDLGKPFACPDVKVLGDKLTGFGFDHTNTIFRNIDTAEVKDVVVLEEGHNSSQSYNDTMVAAASATTSNVKLSGYLQCHRYFHKYRNSILEMFSPDEDSLNKIKNKYPGLFDPSKTCISLHVRQMYGNNIMYTPGFFYKAAANIAERVSNASFYIFSDNIEWCKKNLHIDGAIYMEENPDYIDLWAMSLCNHNILSHSTMSWWGAYLNQHEDKIIIYPEDALRIWWGCKHPHPVHTERKTEHYFDDWECLTSNTLA